MNIMQSIQRGAMLLAALVMSLMTAGIAQAQRILPSYVGKFTLTTPVHWGKRVLPPGEYTIRIDSMALPRLTLIQKEGSVFAFVMSASSNDYQGNPRFSLETPEPWLLIPVKAGGVGLGGL